MLLIEPIIAAAFLAFLRRPLCFTLGTRGRTAQVALAKPPTLFSSGFLLRSAAGSVQATLPFAHAGTFFRHRDHFPSFPTHKEVRMSRMLTRGMVFVAAGLILSSAWADSPKTPQETQYVARLMQSYAARGLTFTEQDEDAALARYRQVEQARLNAQALAQTVPASDPAQRLAIQLTELVKAGVLPPSALSMTPAQKKALLKEYKAAAAQSGPGYSPERQAAPNEPPGEGAAIAAFNRAAAAKMAAVAGGQFVAGGAGAAAGGAPASPSVPSTTAVHLAQEIAQRHASAALTVFTPRQDGFVANGQAFVDPMGRIVMFGGDTASGDVTYFIQDSPDTLQVRFTNIHSQLPPITVGSIQLEQGMMRFQSADGTQVAGENIIPAGRGVIVARATTVFDYTFGAAPTHQLLPPNYELAPYQRGDVAGTGYVLLRREISQQEKANVVGAVANLFHVVTNSEHDKDYALFNVRTGNTVYLNIAESDEQVGHGIDCRPKNAFVNKCGGWVSHASLYDNDGQPNILHYYWRIEWAQTPVGPIAVALERGVEDVDAIQLDTDTVKTVFHRALGIKSAKISQNPDGSLAVTANWAFHDHVVPNVDTLFASAGAQASAAADAPASGVKQPTPTPGASIGTPSATGAPQAR